MDATVSDLIARICTVLDVHVADRPPAFTFAIVAVEGDAQKCAKTFNNGTLLF